MLTNICNVIIIAVNVQAMRHVKQDAAPFCQNVSSLAIEGYNRRWWNWSQTALFKDIGRDVKGFRVPNSFSSME